MVRPSFFKRDDRIISRCPDLVLKFDDFDKVGFVESML